MKPPAAKDIAPQALVATQNAKGSAEFPNKCLFYFTMSTPKTFNELVQHMQTIYNDLSPQFQLGARYLLEHPKEIATLSARQLARRAHVQPSTLVRLAQRLGYSGWTELKTLCTQDYFNVRPGGYADRASSLAAHTPISKTAWEDTITQYSANLQSLESANHEAIDKAVDQLAKARRIVVAGFRSSYAPAFSLYYLCNLFRSDVYLLHNIGGVTALDVHRLNSDDTVVVISFYPYSRESLSVAEAARSTGCNLIALCDSPVAPIALNATATLIFPTTGTSFFPSTVATHALVETLARLLLVHDREAGVERLAQTEALLYDSKAYL